MTATLLYRPDSDYPIDLAKVPELWVVTVVGDVTGGVRQGFPTSRHNEDGIGIPQLRPMNIGTDGKVVLKQVKFVEDNVNLRVSKGDVIFNNTNSAELVGKTAFFEEDGEWTFSNHITRLKIPLPFSARFIAYQFLFLWREGYFRRKSTQHVSQASINGRTLTETIPLLIAPTLEQESIVAELQRRFEHLSSVEQAILRARSRLDDYEKFVVQAATEGSLVPTADELSDGMPDRHESAANLLRQLRHQNSIDEKRALRVQAGRQLDIGDRAKRLPSNDELELPLPELPMGWVWARVADVGSVTLGRQRSPEHHSGPNMRPYLRVANVYEDCLDLSDVKEMNFTPAEFEKYQLQHGDVLLNEGQSPELVGRPAMFRGEVQDICFQNHLIRFRAYQGVSPGFALLVFRAYLHNGRFRSIAKWTTNIASLGAKRFAALEFPLPPLVEQERIVAEAARRMDVADRLSKTLAAVLEQVDAARHLALSKAFTGSLVPSIAGDRPATEAIEQVRAGRFADTRPKPRVSKGKAMVKVPARRVKARVPLTHALAEADGPLTPEELFAASGIGEDLVDEFFAELKVEHVAGRIQQTRDAKGAVSLSGPELVR